MKMGVLAAALSADLCGLAMGPVGNTDVFIGTSGLGHVTPAASYPFGMVQAGPDTSSGQNAFRPDWAHTCGYQHADTWLWRFSQTHVSGTGCPSLGDIAILPVVGEFDWATRPAKMLKESEFASPGRYGITIEENGNPIRCEVVAMSHSAYYRLQYPKGGKIRLALDLDWGISNEYMNEDCWRKYVISSDCTFPSSVSACGGRHVFNWSEYRVFFAMQFSSPIVSRKRIRSGDGHRGEIWELSFGELANGVLDVRIGLSSTSVEKASGNLLAEMPAFDFEDCRARSGAGWKEALSRIEIGDDTPEGTAASFRSALYRTMLQPNDLGDVGGRPFYSTLSLWDTFRAAHPLYTIMVPERVDGMVDSMLRQCDEQGYLPLWALGGSETHCMIGKHAVPVIVDAYLKGFRGFDVEKAWRAVRQSLTQSHHAVNDGTWGLMKEDWEALDKYGYYPFDKLSGSYGKRGCVKGESVSRTLEIAYDDACAARFANALGKADDARFFTARAKNWRNVFDPETGFMRGKDSKGNWREPFDPWALGGGPWHDNDFCEGNAWQYTWHVMHDPEGLVSALGGRNPFVKKLTDLFEQPHHEYANRPSSDVTGLIGQYAHGNEPSHHVIYFFTLVGRNDLTAKYVRKVFDTQYSAKVDGLCGNDDCGQMAAWYVFSALGFYPFDPCGGKYVLGAPQVPKATIRLPSGKRFVVIAENFGTDRPCVQSVRLNGRVLSAGVIDHADVMAGGELVFEMCAASGR